MHDTKIGWWATGLAIFAYPMLKKICGDGGSFVFEAYKYFGLRVEISKKLKPHGWQVLPKTLDNGADFCLTQSLLADLAKLCSSSAESDNFQI